MEVGVPWSTMQDHTKKNFNVHKLPVRILSQLTPWYMLYAVQHIPKYCFQLKLYLKWWLCNLSQCLWQKYLF